MDANDYPEKITSVREEAIRRLVSRIVKEYERETNTHAVTIESHDSVGIYFLSYRLEPRKLLFIPYAKRILVLECYLTTYSWGVEACIWAKDDFVLGRITHKRCREFNIHSAEVSSGVKTIPTFMKDSHIIDLDLATN